MFVLPSSLLLCSPCVSYQCQVSAEIHVPEGSRVFAGPAEGLHVVDTMPGFFGGSQACPIHACMQMASQRKKTIIVDGEIYAGEDDPRYQEMLRRRAQASQAQAAPAAAAPAPGAGAHHAQGGAPRRAPQQGGGGFDFSKPPLRFVDPLPGTALMQGIPDLEVGVFWGWLWGRASLEHLLECQTR